MIKRFCDKCGKPIENYHYRVLSVSDPDGNLIFAQGKTILDTMDSVDLCMDCVRKILRIIKNNN